MVRTRSSLGKRAARPEGDDGGEKEVATPSFNGRLSKFQYAKEASESPSTTKENRNAIESEQTTTASTGTGRTFWETHSPRTRRRKLLIMGAGSAAIVLLAQNRDRNLAALRRLRSARAASTSTDSEIPTSASTPPPKKKRKPSRYAPPSTYAHLPPLTDILRPALISVFIGTNPGLETSRAGHAYAHPSNLFYKLLHASGLTPDRRLDPTEDVTLPAKYCLGNTNIVSRPSRDAAELSKEEMVAGALILEAKIRKWKPESVCVVGKGIWEAIWRSRYGRNPKKTEFKYGWQDEKENMGLVGEEGDEEKEEEEEKKEKEGDGDGDGGDGSGEWKGARVFVTTSTSGLAANTSWDEKVAIWKPFGVWVQKRREERGFISEAETEAS